MHGIIEIARQGNRLSNEQALQLTDSRDLTGLMQATAAIRDSRYPSLVSYPPKVFIPLTQLCRDVCHYCTFAQAPKRGHNAYLTPEQVLLL